MLPTMQDTSKRNRKLLPSILCTDLVNMIKIVYASENTCVHSAVVHQSLKFFYLILLSSDNDLHLNYFIRYALVFTDIVKLIVLRLDK